MTHTTTPGGPGGGQLSYAYAVSRDEPAARELATRLTGPDGATVRTVTGGSLAAAVSSVPERDFSEEGLTARLEDLTRLEDLARSHHAVIDALAARTTVLPLRLGTVYLDDERVADMLLDSGDAFGRLLDRLDGHVEWGVKVYALPHQGDEEPAEGTPGPGATASPGRAYLRRRRSQRAERQQADRAVAEAVRRVRDAAVAEAADRVAHRPQQGGLAEVADAGGEWSGMRNVANESYLVHRDRSGEFCSAVEAAAGDLPGTHVLLTGPWAPYSFSAASAGAVVEQEGSRAPG